MSLSGKVKRLRRFLRELYKPRNTQGASPRTQEKPPWVRFEGVSPNLNRTPNKALLIGVHEATGTGAPKTALELGIGLSREYRVIFVLMKDGPQRRAFLEVGAAVYVITKDIDATIRRVVEVENPQVAILNSISTSSMAKSLASRNVPTVSFIHEFRESSQAVHSTAAQRFSTEVIFSNRATAESFEWSQLRPYHVIPQVPLKEGTSGPPPSAELLEIIRSNVVVSGGGLVSPRKGVDLFIETCRQVALDPKLDHVVFVWCGSGHESQDTYARLIRHQLSNSGIRNRFFFAGHVDMKVILENSNLFLLTSRLDPLPNIAIEAAIAGIPVLGFRNVTGLGEYLPKFEELATAAFDTTKLATQVSKMLTNPRIADSAGTSIGTQARTSFRFDIYIEEIRIILASAIRKMNRAVRILDKARKAQSSRAEKLFRQTDLKKPLELVAEINRGGGLEKFPGFSSRIFLTELDDAYPGLEGYLSFIDAGRPRGPWCFLPIFPEIGSKRSSSRLKTTVHFHVNELLGAGQVLSLMSGLPATTRILFTSHSSSILESLEDLGNRHLQGFENEFLRVENFGRNFGALSQVLNAGYLNAADLVLHIHNKVSPHLPASTVSEWRSDLFNDLLSPRIVRPILNAFESDSSLGLVYSASRSSGYWDGTDPSKYPTLFPNEKFQTQPDYPVGGMFWARRRLLSRLFDGLPAAQLRTPEPLKTDGEFVHALERSVSSFAIAANYSIAKTYKTNLMSSP